MLALLAQILHGGFACAHQIAYGFVPRIWYPDLRQFAGAVKSRQSEGIPAIGLDTLARPLGDQGRRDDRTIMPESRDLAMQAVASRPRLITE
jgi:hypothetical protein